MQNIGLSITGTSFRLLKM